MEGGRREGRKEGRRERRGEAGGGVNNLQLGKTK